MVDTDTVYSPSREKTMEIDEEIELCEFSSLKKIFTNTAAGAGVLSMLTLSAAFVNESVAAVNPDLVRISNSQTLSKDLHDLQLLKAKQSISSLAEGTFLARFFSLSAAENMQQIELEYRILSSPDLPQNMDLSTLMTTCVDGGGPAAPGSGGACCKPALNGRTRLDPVRDEIDDEDLDLDKSTIEPKWNPDKFDL